MLLPIYITVLAAEITLGEDVKKKIPCIWPELNCFFAGHLYLGN